MGPINHPNSYDNENDDSHSYQRRPRDAATEAREKKKTAAEHEQHKERIDGRAVGKDPEQCGSQ